MLRPAPNNMHIPLLTLIIWLSRLDYSYLGPACVEGGPDSASSFLKRFLQFSLVVGEVELGGRVKNLENLQMKTRFFLPGVALAPLQERRITLHGVVLALDAAFRLLLHRSVAEKHFSIHALQLLPLGLRVEFLGITFRPPFPRRELVWLRLAADDSGGQFKSFVEISTDFSTDFSTEFL